MGNTYDKVQENRQSADYKEILNQVIDFEYMIFWNRKKSDMKYILISRREDGFEDGNQKRNIWEGRAKSIKTKIS